MVVMDKEPPNNKDEVQVESDHRGSDELNSYSSTNDDELVSTSLNIQNIMRSVT